MGVRSSVSKPDAPSVWPAIPTRELWARALQSVPEIFTVQELLEWFEVHAPWVDPLWIEGGLIRDTVNDPGRRHVPAPEDLLFRRRDGRYESYDPSRHGRWSRAGRPLRAPGEATTRTIDGDPVGIRGSLKQDATGSRGFIEAPAPHIGLLFRADAVWRRR
jgi:hypothetical protein